MLSWDTSHANYFIMKSFHWKRSTVLVNSYHTQKHSFVPMIRWLFEHTVSMYV